MPCLKSAPTVASPNSQRTAQGVYQMLDIAFGFFVWAAHFLAVYVGTAVACVVGLGDAEEGSQTLFLAALAFVTIAATLAVAWHGWRRFRQQRNDSERAFGLSMAIGCDAIALVAILWQLYPLWLVPVCA